MVKMGIGIIWVAATEKRVHMGGYSRLHTPFVVGNDDRIEKELDGIWFL